MRSSGCLKNDSANANRLSKIHGCIRFHNFRARADARDMHVGAWLLCRYRDVQVTAADAPRVARVRAQGVRRRVQRGSGPGALYARAANLGRFSSGFAGIGGLLTGSLDSMRHGGCSFQRPPLFSADRSERKAYTIISSELPSSLKIVRSNRHSSRCPAVWPPCLR